MRMNGVSFGIQTPASSRWFPLAADHPSSQAFPLPVSPPLAKVPLPLIGQGREEGGSRECAGSETEADGRPTGECQLSYLHL